jgi:PncC family amidohydrolase
MMNEPEGDAQQHAVHSDGKSAAAQTAAQLSAAGATLATAESCTGGGVAHAITSVPGSSAFFLGGVVAYADRVKTSLLGVHPETLSRHGAVSDATAREMARGARARFESDYAVAVTGIAGPRVEGVGESTGRPEQPVGLVYLAVAGPAGVTSEEYHFEGDRAAIRAAAVLAALRAVCAAEAAES